MTSFTILAALMLLLAIALLIRPLLRTPKSSTVDQQSLNLDIYKQHLQELDSDLENGQINQAEYTIAQQDLEKQLIMDIPDSEQKTESDLNRSPLSQVTIIITLPILAIGLYLYLGEPDALNAPQVKHVSAADAHANAKQPEKALPSVSEMIVKLEQKIQEEPNNVQGWRLLSRAYMHTRQFDKAEKAYNTLTTLKSDDPNIWADYADIVAVNQKGSLDGKPFEYIKRALALQPKHPKALWLAGTYHFQKNNYKKAIRFWDSLKAQIPPASKDADMINASINDAKKRLGLPLESKADIASTEKTKTGAELGITGTVTLSKRLSEKTSPTDTVFVYARAAQGPRMPLAIVKKQVKDLPFEFTLDDSMAMMPQMKLSNFESVVVTARISKSGNAMTQPGDLIAEEINTTSRNSKPVSLKIDHITP